MVSSILIQFYAVNQGEVSYHFYSTLLAYDLDFIRIYIHYLVAAA